MVNNQGNILLDLVSSKRISKTKLASKLDVSRTMLYKYFEMPELPKTVIETFCKEYNIEKSEFTNVNSVSEPIVEYKSLNCIYIPLKAVGGFLAGYENKVYLDELEKFSFNRIKGECYCFEVEGLSMYKSKLIDGEIYETGYKPGSFVIATKVENFSWLSKNKDYVFQTTDGLIIKKYDKIVNDKFQLLSINNEYNPVPGIPVRAVKGIYFIEFTETKIN